MLEKIQAYRDFDLGWWVDRLEVIIGKFRDIVDNNTESDIEWINSFYKFHSMSGGPKITGHVLDIFPYIKNYRGKFVPNAKLYCCGTDSFPSGKTAVPFIWDYLGNKRKMEFRTFTVPVFEKGCVTTEPVVQVVEL